MTSPQKTTLVIIILIVITSLALAIYYNYSKNNSPLPYEEDYNQVYVEQGLPGIDYEYTGPNLENPATEPNNSLIPSTQ